MLDLLKLHNVTEDPSNVTKACPLFRMCQK